MSKRNKKTNKIVKSNVVTQDTYINPLANLGLGLDNMLSATTYTNNKLTQNFQLLTTLYRSNWIVAKVVDLVADSMTEAGIKIKSDISPELLKRVEKCIQKTKVDEAVNEALKWARLYGGSGALMLIEGQEDRLEEPLDLDTVLLGDFKGLLSFDRWSGIRPSLEIVEDISNPEFGKPKYYEVTLEDGTLYNVHHSRILRFSNRKLPRYEKQMELGWGISEIEIVYEELVKRDNSSHNISGLMFLANLRVLKMGELGESIAQMDSHSQQEVYSTLSAQAKILNNFGLYLMGKDDSFDTKSYSFAGIAEVLTQFMYDLSGASSIPATKFWGRSPGGLNSTGESDENDYNKLIKNKQSVELTGNYTKILPVIFMSELGFVPDDFEIEHNSIESVKENEIADVVDKKMQSVKGAFEGEIITQKEARLELKQIGKQYNMFTNIDEKVTESADNSLNSFNTNQFNSGEINGQLLQTSGEDSEVLL